MYYLYFFLCAIEKHISEPHCSFITMNTHTVAYFEIGRKDSLEHQMCINLRLNNSLQQIHYSLLFA